MHALAMLGEQEGGVPSRREIDGKHQLATGVYLLQVMVMAFTLSLAAACLKFSLPLLAPDFQDAGGTTVGREWERLPKAHRGRGT